MTATLFYGRWWWLLLFFISICRTSWGDLPRNVKPKPVLTKKSIFECGDTSSATPWELTVADNEEVASRLQNWIAAYQHGCARKNSKEKSATYSTQIWPRGNGAGIGSSVVGSTIAMIESIAVNQIFRPTQMWQWADLNASKCVSKIGSIDCFTIPLSYCSLGDAAMIEKRVEELHINFTDAVLFMDTRRLGGSFANKSLTMCDIARISKKTLYWTFGQFLHYHIMRVPYHLDDFYYKRLHKVFPRQLETMADAVLHNRNGHNKHYHHIGRAAASVDPGTGLTCVSAALHVRGGAPDGKRVPFTGPEHAKALEKYSSALALSNKTICTVYVAGDHMDAIIFSPNEPVTANAPPVEYDVIVPGKEVQAQQPFPSSFVFTSLPHFRPRPAEIEFQISRLQNSSNNITMEYVYAEFVSDLIVFAHADIFIGSHSNVYAIVASLREAYHPEYFNNQSCYLDSHASKRDPSGGPSTICLGDSIPFFRDAFGGFSAGSFLFPDSGR